MSSNHTIESGSWSDSMIYKATAVINICGSMDNIEAGSGQESESNTLSAEVLNGNVVSEIENNETQEQVSAQSIEAPIGNPIEKPDKEMSEQLSELSEAIPTISNSDMDGFESNKTTDDEQAVPQLTYCNDCKKKFKGQDCGDQVRGSCTNVRKVDVTIERNGDAPGKVFKTREISKNCPDCMAKDITKIVSNDILKQFANVLRNSPDWVNGITITVSTKISSIESTKCEEQGATETPENTENYETMSPFTRLIKDAAAKMAQKSKNKDIQKATWTPRDKLKLV